MKFPISFDNADRSLDAAVDALLLPAMSQQMHAMNNTTDGSRSKAPRQDFVWTRLMMAGTTTHPALVIKEKPSMPLLTMMLDMDADRIGSLDTYKKMEAYERSMNLGYGVRNVRFEQKDYSVYAKSLEEASGVKYEGQVKIGRAYTSSPLPYFPKIVLNTMYKGTHLEVDIKSSYPTMLWNAFGQKGNMHHLEELAVDPEKLYADVFGNFGVERSDFKTAILAMMGAFPASPGTYGLDEDKMDVVRKIAELPFISGFKDDLNTLMTEMNEKYRGFVGTLAHYAEANGKLDHVGGIAMTIFAGDMEHECMRLIIKQLGGGHPDNFLWKYDGVAVPMEIITEDKMRSLEKEVLEKLGIELKLSLKSLHSPSFGISLAPSEATEDAAYQAWKKRHEKTYFCCKLPPNPVRICPDGTIQHLAIKDYNYMTAPEPAEFNKRWWSDPSRKTFSRLDFLPPPLDCPDSVYNTYHGMAAESFDDVDPGYSIEPYLNHVKLLTGDDDINADYMNKLLAFKFQNPASLWRVMPFIRSTPGVGKDLWFDFLAEIMGKENTVKVVKLGEVMGNQTHRLSNKLLACITEADFKDGSTYHEELKDRITSPTITVKQKYVNDYDATSCVCLIAFSNNFQALNFSSDDRRFFAVTADGRYANDPVYFAPLIEWMQKIESKRAVYDYYMKMDIGDFDPSAERVVTETFKEMASSNISLVEMLVKENFEDWIRDAQYDRNDIKIRGDHLRVPVSLCLDIFCEKAKDFEYKGSESRSKMAQLQGRLNTEMASKVRRFSKIDRHVIEDIKSHGIRYRVFEIEGIRGYLESIKTENDMDEDEIEQPAMLIAPQR